MAGYKDALIRTGEDGTTISRAFSGKTMRVVRNEFTRFYDEHPSELDPFPAQLGKSIEEGAFHLGGERGHPRGRPRRASATRPARGWGPSRP